MRLMATFLSVFALVGVLALTAQAADKEVTLKGKIMCAKCALKLVLQRPVGGTIAPNPHFTGLISAPLVGRQSVCAGTDDTLNNAGVVTVYFTITCALTQQSSKGGAVVLEGVRKCTTCIKVKEGDKDVVYLFLDKGNKEEYHEEVCGGGEKEGTVTGAVFEKDGKKWIKPKEVKYVK